MLFPYLHLPSKNIMLLDNDGPVGEGDFDGLVGVKQLLLRAVGKPA